MAKTRPFRPTFLGNWLTAAGLYQVDLARALDLSPQQVSAVLKGERQYTQVFLEGAAAYLSNVFPGLTPGDLITVDPLSDRGVTILRAAQNVPEAKRADVAKMLTALSDEKAAPFVVERKKRRPKR